MFINKENVLKLRWTFFFSHSSWFTKLWYLETIAVITLKYIKLPQTIRKPGLHNWAESLTEKKLIVSKQSINNKYETNLK